MAELVTQFDEALSNVERDKADKENAATAHAEVRACLEADTDLCALGIDTVLIGSYKRNLSIRRVKDVDVFSKLPDLDGSLGSREVLNMFVGVLAPGYGERIQRQDRSIKVDFPDYDLHVDVVPARSSGTYWQIPDRTEAGAGWQLTNPEEMTSLTTAMNARYNGLYVPVVKLIRQTRQAHVAKRPGGLFFEVLSYHAFDDGIEGDNVSQLYVGALRQVANRLDKVVDGAEVSDPTMSEAALYVRVTQEQMESAAAKFAGVASMAEGALADKGRCTAAMQFRKCLGKNGDGVWVFPLPSDCNEDGSQKEGATIVAGDSHVPAGNRRFA